MRTIERSMIVCLLAAGCMRTDGTCPPVVASATSDAATATAGVADAGASPAALGFVPTNLGRVDGSGPLGDLVFSGDCQLNHDDDGMVTCDGGQPSGYRSFQAMQSDGSLVRVFLARSIRVPASATVRGLGGAPLALVALDTLEVSGTVTVAANHGAGFAGGALGNNPLEKQQGRGAGGGKPGVDGGGGAFCGKGGAGVGTGGGAPGVPYGAPSLSPLVGGSAGGNADSGGGGGALQLVAGGKLTIATSGIVNAGGGGGDNGEAGGGSGGAILIEAPTVTIAGKLAANGGSGDAGLSGGGSALDATTDAAPTTGPVGGSNTNGGNGGGGAMPDGASGGLNPMYPDGGFSGAGGGGAGRIRINTASGSAGIIGGALSPTLATPCATQGMLP
jgi:hypothetical protein